MAKEPVPSILSREQANRLREATQIATEIERIDLQRQLQAKLRADRYKAAWLKPYDLWSPPAQFLGAVIISTALATLLAITAHLAVSAVGLTGSA